MQIELACLLLAGGLVLLWKSADWLVDGAVGLAKRLGVSPLVIGLTIVAMGTSAPEVAASIAAALREAGNVAIGNVFGSNIANLALVGGVAALIRPTQIQLRTLRREMPAMLVVALVLWPVLLDGKLLRVEGLGLLVLFAGLIVATVFSARKESASGIQQQEIGGVKGDAKKSVVFVVIGLAGLALGADMVVRGAVVIGERLG
ncbi:MAG: sodium:calcium antiporter, partial [Planctomycetota bacterium]